jgi:alkylation response protein AidB-like acyl-CoA dehydrogenase
MDLDYTPAEQAFRDDVRRWLEANVPRTALPSGDTAEGFALHVEWEKKLFEAKYAVVSWPKAFGGREASLVEWLIFEEEYYRASAPQRVTQNGIFLLAPTLFEFGTEEQKQRILPRMAAAQDLWCQGWSEPNAGSDLAGIKATARRDDARGGWLLTGQKTWCTRGAFCDYMFGLFRSDPSAERHKGMTYFLVHLKAPGVTVRPVGRLDGDDGFAEVFLEDVFVPDRDVLGGVNQGWNVAMATTSSERGLTLRSPGRFVATAARLIDLYRKKPDRRLRDRVVQAYMDAEAYRLYTLQTVTKVVAGGSIGADSSLNKIFWSEMDVRMHETALELLGERAELIEGATEAESAGLWMKGFQFALAGPIYAGTNEIQRNIAAERVLGLPRLSPNPSPSGRGEKKGQ